MTSNTIEEYGFSRGAIARLGIFVGDAIQRELEATRIARAGCALLLAGASPNAPLFQAASALLRRRQRSDGGWADTDETGWAACMLRLVHGEDDPAVESAQQWLNSERQSTGGWGRHSRDQARIPTTALVNALVPSVVQQQDKDWLADEWQRDMNGQVRLSYKAGFFLLFADSVQYGDLVLRTIAHLAADQNDDFGFGPWRGHPLGSEPWSTGVVLWGLSRWKKHVDADVFKKALTWLETNQLDSGYWKYHYLDDGASLALIGGAAAVRATISGE